jgi:hypothetical protein
MLAFWPRALGGGAARLSGGAAGAKGGKGEKGVYIDDL